MISSPVLRAAVLATASVVALAACRSDFEPDPTGPVTPPPPPSSPGTVPFRVGSFGTDYAKGVAVDAFGAAYVVSYFGGTVDFDPGTSNTSKISQGGSDIALAKYTATGAFAWAASLGGPGSELPFDVRLAPGGAVYVTGYAGAGVVCNGKEVPNAGGRDILLARFTATGTCQWAIAIGGTKDDEGRALAVDPVSGDAIVTGLFRGQVDFNPGAGTANLTARGGSDGFIARYGADGSYKNVAQFGGTDDDEGTAIARTAEGDFIVGGDFRGVATFGSALAPQLLTSLGESDFFVARYENGLGLQWAGGSGGAGVDLLGGIAIEPSGTILVAGMFSGSADVAPGPANVTLVSQGASDVFLARYDGAGFYSGLAKRFGGSGADGVTSLRVDLGGNIYLGGWFQGSVDFDPGAGVHVLNAQGTAGAGDAYVLALDASTGFRWVAPVGAVISGDASIAIAAGLALTGDDAIWAVGRFFGRADLDPGAGAVTVQSLGDADQWVARFEAGSGVLRR